MSIADDVLAAEYLASREATEDVGVLFEYWERMSQFARKSCERGRSDQQELVRSISSGENPLAALADYAGKVAVSSAEGVLELMAASGEQAVRMAKVHSLMWRSFSPASRKV